MVDRRVCRVRWRRGFTLIELLIVVAIIAILAAIAVPNFLEAQTRSKVARVKADQRSVATAVEAYRVDNNRYPPRTKSNLGNLRGLAEPTLRAEEMSRFTTPVAYISSLPVDIFENGIAAPNNLIDYYDPLLVYQMTQDPPSSFSYTDARDSANSQSYRYGWMLLSVGPDGEVGEGSFNFGANFPPPRLDFLSWNDEYDPTNGTISPGNVTRFQATGVTATDAFR